VLFWAEIPWLLSCAVLLLMGWLASPGRLGGFVVGCILCVVSVGVCVCVVQYVCGLWMCRYLLWCVDVLLWNSLLLLVVVGCVLGW
jgi:hypothetical protein